VLLYNPSHDSIGRLTIIFRATVANTLIPGITLCRRRVSLRKRQLAQRFQILRSELLTISLIVMIRILILHSIPHSSQTNSHNNLSVSPTNSSSPVKESALSHDPQADDGPPNDTDVDDVDAKAENENPVDDTPLRHADTSEAETT
jgi:hypothetical protein